MRNLLILFFLAINIMCFSQVTMFPNAKQSPKELETNTEALYDSTRNSFFSQELSQTKGQKCQIGTTIYEIINVTEQAISQNFTLRNTSNNKIEKFSRKSYRSYNDKVDNLILLGHFEKLRQTYVGKNLILVEYDNKSTDFYVNCEEYLICSFENQEPIKDIKLNTVWHCSDIMVKPIESTNIRLGSKIVLIIENPNYGKCYFYVDYLSSFATDNSNIANKFQREDLFQRNEQEKKDAIKKYGQQYGTYYSKLYSSDKKRFEEYSKKWGAYTAKEIIDGYVHIGWTKEKVIQSWGEPDHINTTTGVSITTEQWCYSSGYVYFKSGKVSSIQTTR